MKKSKKVIVCNNGHVTDLEDMDEPKWAKVNPGEKTPETEWKCPQCGSNQLRIQEEPTK